MSAPFSVFLQQRHAAKTAGIAILRKIFKTHEFPQGVTTKKLYELASAEPAPPGFQPYPLSPPILKLPKNPKKTKKAVFTPKDFYPPRPDHPIRSVAFLKKDILAALRDAKEIRTVRQRRVVPTPEEELEALANPATKRERKALSVAVNEHVWKVLPPQQPPPAAAVKEVIGREVGVGADISHLNKRRQRARVEKVGQAVLKMKGIRSGLKPRPLDGKPYYRGDVTDA